MLAGSHEYAVFIPRHAAFLYGYEKQVIRISTGMTKGRVGEVVAVTAKLTECLQAVIRPTRGKRDHRYTPFLDGFHLLCRIILGGPHGAGIKHSTLDSKAVADILFAAAVFIGKLFLPFIPLVSAEPLFHRQQGIVDIKHHQHPVFFDPLSKREGIGSYIRQVGGFPVAGLN